MLNRLTIALCIMFIFYTSTFAAKTDALSNFKIGASISDITGSPLGRPMLGYGSPTQTTLGIHTRLHARAFVIEDPVSEKRLALVVADLGLMFDSVKTEVLKKLNILFPDKFSDDNLLLSATHTHAGPGGFSHHDIFNVSTLGFDFKNFEIITEGITQSIANAYRYMQPGKIFITQGELLGVSRNRSLTAYYANSDWQNFEHTVDQTSLLLKFQSELGKDIGIFNWFSVHATCMSNQNRLISSDNKGRAAEWFEREFPDTVAAFANSNEGDVSPLFDIDKDGKRKKDLDLDLKLVEENGFQQFLKAKELFENARQTLSQRIESRLVWVHMPWVTKGCTAAMGYSFAAGAEDGTSDVPGIFEGMRSGETTVAPPLEGIAFFLRLILGGSNEGDKCHYPKIILVSTSQDNPDLLPETIPFQLVVIGELAIAAVPSEITTMAGRRLKKTVLDELGSFGVTKVALSTLTNDYSGYVTTFEEYDRQQYEGGFTLYGPHTLEIYQQVFFELAKSIKENRSIFIHPKRAPRVASLRDYESKSWWDEKQSSERFGSALRQPRTEYQAGETVTVEFRSSHPKNSLGRLNNFLTVEFFQDGNWQPVFFDQDKETKIMWINDSRSECRGCLKSKIIWNIPANVLSGIYRIRHFGYWKSANSKKLNSFEGQTRAFTVSNPKF
ncbi:MAG: neutral/alkaline non-lysosomal ceramidase N-terminal domain-containing protein [Bdellovibrio sp.]|nr:neutral/alkaline non-lysosomal ceramidase N-terminal domain-containing protein [Bdellovibrio sp.]